MVTYYRGLFEGWEIALTKVLIGQFRSRWRSLERESFEDLLQECLVHWYGVRNQFDASRETSRKAFLASVVRNKLTDLVRERGATKRGGDFVEVSLDETLSDSEDAPTFADLLDAAGTRGPDEGNGVDYNDARIDIAKALQKLTPRQRRLCLLLGEEGLSIKEVAERLAIPRGTLYEEIKRIRKVFSDQGLGDYLDG